MSDTDQRNTPEDSWKEAHEALCRDGRFRQIHSVTELPESVQDLLRKCFRHTLKGADESTQQRFRDNRGRLRLELPIADVGKPSMQSCVWRADRPMYGLESAGVGERLAILICRHGGLSSGSKIVVFEFDQEKAAHLYTGHGPLGPAQLMKDLTTRSLEELELRTAKDVDGAAQKLIKRHGEMALSIAADRADERQKKGNAHGNAVWLQVLKSVQLRQPQRQAKQ